MGLDALCRLGAVAGVIGVLAGACSQTPEPVTKAPDAAGNGEAEGVAAASDESATAGAPEAAQDATAPAAAEPSAAAPAQPTEAALPDARPEAASSTQPSSPSSAPPPAPAASPRPGLVIIDPGGEESGAERSLVAVARAERERRANAPTPTRVITNQNLVKAEGEKPGRKPAARPASAPPEATSSGGVPVQDLQDEAYWRRRSRELRLRWKEATDDIAALESDADDLRRRFYAESDPYVRDTRIKPDWDRVLDRIREAQDEAVRQRRALEAHLEAGRQAGAQPGWLRDGIELEPQDEQTPDVDPEAAIEPPTYPEPFAEPPLGAPGRLP